VVNRPSLEEIIHFFLSVLFSKNFIKYLNKWVGSFFNDRCIDEGWIENRDRRNDNEIRVVFLQDKIMKKNQQIKMKIIQRDEILLFSHFIHVAMRNASSSFRRRESSSRFLYKFTIHCNRDATRFLRNHNYYRIGFFGHPQSSTMTGSILPFEGDYLFRNLFLRGNKNQNLDSYYRTCFPTVGLNFRDSTSANIAETSKRQEIFIFSFLLISP